MHQYDCLRANKATSAWGLEARVPFLDKEFINVAMSIDPESKMVISKLVPFFFKFGPSISILFAFYTHSESNYL